MTSAAAGAAAAANTCDSQGPRCHFTCHPRRHVLVDQPSQLTLLDWTVGGNLEKTVPSEASLEKTHDGHCCSWHCYHVRTLRRSYADLNLMVSVVEAEFVVVIVVPAAAAAVAEVCHTQKCGPGTEIVFVIVVPAATVAEVCHTEEYNKSLREWQSSLTIDRPSREVRL